jgi:hypothetical protein
MPTIVWPQIADAVRAGVAARAWTVDHLATAADLPPERVRRLLDQNAPVSSLQLDQISEALGLDPQALREGRAAQAQRPSVFLRHGPLVWQDFYESDRDHLDAALDGARAWCTLLRALHQTNGLRTRGSFTPVDVRGPEPRDAARQGYDLAARVRRDVGLGAGFLGDVRALLEDRFAVAVAVAPLRTRSPAQGVLDADRVAATVVLNANDEERTRDPLLDRVHLAHELCHLLFDPTEPGRLHLVIEDAAPPRSKRSALAREVTQMLGRGLVALEEARARGFAAELLLPEAGLHEVLGLARKEAADARAHALVQKARMHFATPWEIAVWHLANRDYIAHKLVSKLLYVGPEGRPQHETTLPAPGRPPISLTRAIGPALEAELITEGQARRLLGVAPGESLGAPP